MSTPKIDPRDRAQILAQLEQLALLQVPELTGTDLSLWRNRKDAGYALAQIFGYMADHVVTQLNKVPEKNLIAYLNMIGTELLPAQPAKTPVNFLLNPAAVTDVLVPKGTQVATAAKSPKPAVIFETQRPINATVAQLSAVVSVAPLEDQVFDHLKELNSSQNQTILFVSPESQEHVLYLGDDALFNFQKGAGDGCVTLEVNTEVGSPLLNANVKWAYYSEDSKAEEDNWKPLQLVKTLESSVQFKQTKQTSVLYTTKKTINNINTYWIRAKFEGPLVPDLASLKSLTVTIASNERADLAFYNDVPINLESKLFYPFGKQPNTADVFYIASRECFSKKDMDTKIEFSMKSWGTAGIITGGSENLLVSWEYWNGKVWSNLNQATFRFVNDGDVKASNMIGTLNFKCPKDITPNKVNNTENYWIRARIASGNFRTITISDSPSIIDNAPAIIDMEISNPTITSQPITYFTAKNNLQFENWEDKNAAFQPFVSLEETSQTLYLGFDKPFTPEGIISVYLSLMYQEYIDATKPQVTWSYFRKKNGKDDWAAIQVLDDTENFTTSGAIEFLAPNDMSPKKKFGQTLYWIRAEVTSAFQFESIENKVEYYIDYFAVQEVGVFENFMAAIKPMALYMRDASVVGASQKYFMKKQRGKTPQASQPIVSVESASSVKQPCTPISVFHPKFSYPAQLKESPAAPIAYGISLNTTLAVQAETVTDELFGKSDGLMQKPLAFSRVPVVSESLWVQEPLNPSTNDSVTVTAENGETWVEWLSVENFFESNQTSRHYTINRTTGTVKFGNGQKGMIPPVGAAIKATYQTGGGTQGNVGLGEAKNIVTAIALVDKAANIDSGQGGADTETVERAKELGPKRVQHRQRAVSKEDYEWLAMEASGAVARAKCIPNLNREGQQELGCVAVIIVPAGTENKPVASSALLRIVENYLKNRCPISISTLTVTTPSYLGLSVEAEILVKSIDSASAIKFSAINQIQTYLHPLYGGPEGKGWDFGAIPCTSDLLAILQRINGVEHVENLKLTVHEDQTGNTLQADDVTRLPGYTLIYSDNHQITVNLSEDA